MYINFDILTFIEAKKITIRKVQCFMWTNISMEKAISYTWDMFFSNLQNLRTKSMYQFCLVSVIDNANIVHDFHIYAENYKWVINFKINAHYINWPLQYPPPYSYIIIHATLHTASKQIHNRLHNHNGNLNSFVEYFKKNLNNNFSNPCSRSK